ncbi:TetR/AcrR family transcriptional regulator [Chryseobacterium paridis]|uniref:TetR/AcrR family transcriptional regulator n=1 Tax=Chryseobacterium paridis TaxID=2800328 RepID=A0ABS1FWE9_9FLAO|nr:TetR/AcrR family transcriptional regulator [Chryseobacterium paridis]MBK1896745.1 TetR/AcrR family transcriptional regulator [Chryseobacterium paridis]
MKSTESKIIDAAVYILNDNDAATIDDIANHIGISRRTIHRYFKDKNSLIECCKQKMMETCNATMITAYLSSDIPLVQMENMFYAALSIGHEYSFVKKRFERSGYSEVVHNEKELYDDVKAKWFGIVEHLQENRMIDHKFTVPWIYNLFGGIIDIAIAAQRNGEIAGNDLKKFAWSSFKGSVGLKEYTIYNKS